MATQYKMSSPGQVVGKALIKEYFPELARANFMFIYQERIDGETGQSVDITSRGKPMYGKTLVVRGLNAFLVGGEADGEGQPFYVILISKTWYDRMNENQRKAFIHQRLCECHITEEGILSLVDYDVHEFNQVAKLYGAWNGSIESFLEVTQQMKLPIKENQGQTDAAAKKNRRSSKRAQAPAEA